MAVFSAVKNKKQTKGSMAGVLNYISDSNKVYYNDIPLRTGINCNYYSGFAEMCLTKQQYKKDDGRQFYQFVQSFPEEDNVTPLEVHQIGLELANKLFPDFEVMVATHCNTKHLHNHIVVNSVSFKTGKKLHQNHDILMEQRMVNDQICMSHGLMVLEPYQKLKRGQAIKQKEYRAAERCQSWKLQLIAAIEDALLYSTDRESFIHNMEYEGYEVNWSDTRKYITYTTPEGYKCRDNKLHDDTYLKENLEKLFIFRQETGFKPLTYEPLEGWLGEMQEHYGLTKDVISMGKNLESVGNTSPPLTPKTWTDRKQKQRENLKKLAAGHKLQSEQEQDFEMTIY